MNTPPSKCFLDKMHRNDTNDHRWASMYKPILKIYAKK